MEGITAYDEKGKELLLKDKKTESDTSATKEATDSDIEPNSTTPIPMDEKNENSDEKPKLDESIEPLFKIQNILKKGGAELSKIDVATADPLPKTGIQILDKDGKIVVEGRTDEKGQFKFTGLPAGNYTFKEFDAPEGYELDETPLPFEITEDNEIVKCEMTNKKIPEKLEPKNPQPKEKGRLPQTGEQKRNRVVVVIGLLLIVSFAGGIGYKRYLKNFNKDN